MNDALPIIEHLKGKIKNLTLAPGVYLMKDRIGTILYVGKASSLKKRVSSYFNRPVHPDAKTSVLVSKIADFEVIVTESEKEALILESNLIKRHRPRYNVLLKDGKRYPSLCLHMDHPFPNLTIIRKTDQKEKRYFGPYASANAVRQTLKIVNKTFTLRKCKNSEFKNVEGSGVDLEDKDCPVCGTKYIKDALQAGANTIVIEDGTKLNPKDINDKITILSVPNTRKFVAIASANFFDNPSRKFKLIGITRNKR